MGGFLRQYRVPPMTASRNELRSTVARRGATASSGRPVAAAIDRFGGELFTHLAAAIGGNIVMSPYSITVALAMTRAGAATETRTQLDRVLHLEGLDTDEAFNALEQALATRTSDSTGYDGEKVSVILATANALWPQSGYPFAAPFLDVLASHYGASLHPVDFERETERSRRAINEWVADRTAERIREVIPKGVLNALTRMVITNAMYLKASWAEPFDASATRAGSFVRLDGSTVEASFMHKTSTVAGAQGPGWQAVELPYVGGKLAMNVIVPDTGRFEAVASTLRNGTASFVARLERRVTQLALPKLRFRTHANLVDTLRELGITDLFDPDRADLSRMTATERLYVSDVIHETFVEVNEAGTEAAAATAVAVAARSAPIEPVRLTVDRPFILALRDVETNSLLFLGRVLDPTV
jgi:serpin B